MYRLLDYLVQFTVVLSAEDYYNAGITREQVKEIINSTTNPSTGRNLYAQPAAINGNWEFAVYDELYIAPIVSEIKYRLEGLVKKSKL